MPAIMDDPASPPVYRVSGPQPFPDPDNPVLPAGVEPRQVVLRDRQTIATIVPLASRNHVPPSLLEYLCAQLAKEIEGGDTYPMMDPMPLDKFGPYWFQNFAGVMLLGKIDSPDQVLEGNDWSKQCLGSFYIKPNYPGRSSHVCNAGFLVTDAARNRGAGRLMGETYLIWAPRLGYSYSVFNLVYETNVASCRIWDALGFKRIGRVKGCGNLKSYPDRLVDAIIFGRELSASADGQAASDPLLVSEERFDKIKFYLKHGRYPNGSDRAEKSRLRSAATHYKLLDNDVLMLKGKEVISDPTRQMRIARDAHEVIGHAGINKTTAVIAEKHHWSRIKETVSDVIRTCTQCKDLAKTTTTPPMALAQEIHPSDTATTAVVEAADIDASDAQRLAMAVAPTAQLTLAELVGAADMDTDALASSYHTAVEPLAIEPDSRVLALEDHHHYDDPLQHRDTQHHSHHHHHHHDIAHLLEDPPQQYANPSDISSLLNPPLSSISPLMHHPAPGPSQPRHHHQQHVHHPASVGMTGEPHDLYHPIDPRIISQSSSQASGRTTHHPHPFTPFPHHHQDAHDMSSSAAAGSLSTYGAQHQQGRAPQPEMNTIIMGGQNDRPYGPVHHFGINAQVMSHEQDRRQHHQQRQQQQQHGADNDPDESFQSLLLHDPDSVMVMEAAAHQEEEEDAAAVVVGVVDPDLDMLMSSSDGVGDRADRDDDDDDDVDDDDDDDDDNMRDGTVDLSINPLSTAVAAVAAAADSLASILADPSSTVGTQSAAAAAAATMIDGGGGGSGSTTTTTTGDPGRPPGAGGTSAGGANTSSRRNRSSIYDIVFDVGD